MWSKLIHRLSRRNGQLTWFGRWYLGHAVGPVPALVDDRRCPGCGAWKGTWRGVTWHEANCPNEREC